MHRFATALLGLLIPTAAAAAPAQPIEAVMQEQQEAWNKGDIDAFMKPYWHSDSLRYIGKSGVREGWQSALDNYKKNYPNKEAMGELSFDILSLEMLGAENAFMIGRWQLTRSEDRLDGHFTLLWRKIDDAWVIVADHTS